MKHRPLSICLAARVRAIELSAAGLESEVEMGIRKLEIEQGAAGVGL
jgi:hypothetical protein